jgi:hypothetical protein
MIIWKTIPVLFKDKIEHVKKIGGKLFRSFIVDYGDIPHSRYNEVSQSWEEIENKRGNSYAVRKRQKYRRNKNERIC